MSALVEMKAPLKFPGVTALKDITFDTARRSTWLPVKNEKAESRHLWVPSAAFYQPTGGRNNCRGSYKRLTPKDSAENGISVIYQELSVINELSIQEKPFVGKVLLMRKNTGFR